VTLDEKKENNLDEKKEKPFTIIGANSLLTKYKMCDKSLKVHLKNGEVISGKIRWFDDYALKIINADESGSVTIPAHNISYYSCEHFLLEGEKDKTNKVFRGVSKSTDKEREQLFKYKRNKELVHFYLEDGTEIKGRFRWYVDHMYCVQSDPDEKIYNIIKRHILYYKKIDTSRPVRTEKGIIKAYKTDKGFGFIATGKEDLFFHISELAIECKDKEILPGLAAEFAIKETKKGNVAVNIKL